MNQSNLGKEMYNAKNFVLYDRVVMTNLGTSELGGKVGSIVGTNLSFGPQPLHYIVLMDEVCNGQKAIYITEACLERVEE